ncbi:MAG: hypothetical protein ACI4U0_01610 [Candidatus Aphodocola sp.]
MSEFNQTKYINEWQKEHKKQFKVDLNKDEFENAEKLLKEKKLTKVGFVRLALKNLENGTLKKEEEDN